MKMKYVWAAALMAPLAVNSQCRVTYLGEAAGQTAHSPVALDESGNAMTSFVGGPTIWGADGSFKANLQDHLNGGAMNNLGQAIVYRIGCSERRPTYSANLAIWKWTDGSTQCLKPLPFEVNWDASQPSIGETVIDDKGWVYANIIDKLNVNRAMAWPPNGAPFELPAPDFSTYKKFLGGNKSGLIVGMGSNHPDLNLGGAPVMWKSGIPSYLSIPFDMQQGEVQSAASNGDMVGSVSGPGLARAGIWWKSGGQQFEVIPNYRPLFVNRHGRSVGWVTSVPFWSPAIYANGVLTEINKIMPSRWTKAGYSVVSVSGLNDKSQILAAYQKDSPEGTLFGAALLSGCFGAKP